MQPSGGPSCGHGSQGDPDGSHVPGSALRTMTGRCLPDDVERRPEVAETPRNPSASAARAPSTGQSWPGEASVSLPVTASALGFSGRSCARLATMSGASTMTLPGVGGGSGVTGGKTVPSGRSRDLYASIYIASRSTTYPFTESVPGCTTRESGRRGIPLLPLTARRLAEAWLRMTPWGGSSSIRILDGCWCVGGRSVLQGPRPWRCRRD